MVEIDSTDRKILNILVGNSRLSMRQIAKKVKVSVATVMNHMKKLEAEKIISKYTARLDYTKIGYDVEVLIEVKVSKGKLSVVEGKIVNHPNVVALYDMTGASDIIVIARFRNRKSMDVFLKKLQTFENIVSTETRLILNIVKEESILIE